MPTVSIPKDPPSSMPTVSRPNRPPSAPRSPGRAVLPLLGTVAGVLGAALLAALAALAVSVAAIAPAAPVAAATSSPVMMTPGPGSASGPDEPYASGQEITVKVAPNSTLAVPNLEAHGYPSGAALFKIYECADPDGLVTNLPTNTYGCDGETISTFSQPNKDGSFTYENYTIYALPDRPSFGESPADVPVCGDTAKTECVLYVGTDVSDFSKPHIFSAPFSVKANATDSGKPAGNGVLPGSASDPGSKTPVLIVGAGVVVVLVAAGLLFFRRQGAGARGGR